RFPNLQIITQNVDDLHEQAGSTRIIRLHGRIRDNKCFANCQGDPTLVDVMQLALSDADREHGPPPCPHCSAPLRPAVVWFGEMLPADQIRAAHQAAEASDVMLVVGTSGQVQPAANLPIIAGRAGAKIIEINPVDNAFATSRDVWLAAPSGEVLPRIVAALDALGARDREG
ncbi:MAG: NAD-dependent deacylase, partial [Chloroflexi bacterium]|nr:NAD-dependent deacylase [Chloroflexota bacterium]